MGASPARACTSRHIATEAAARLWELSVLRREKWPTFFRWQRGVPQAQAASWVIPAPAWESSNAGEKRTLCNYFLTFFTGATLQNAMYPIVTTCNEKITMFVGDELAEHLSTPDNSKNVLQRGWETSLNLFFRHVAFRKFVFLLARYEGW